MRAAVLCALSLAAALALRVPGSPYPLPERGLNASAVLRVVDSTALSADDAYTLMTLQGVTSRVTPRIFRLDPSSAYSLWLNETASLWGVALDRTCGSSLACLLAALKGEVAGYALVALDDNSTNLGIMAGVAARAIAVTTANEAAAQAAGLAQLYDLRGRDLAWALDTFGRAAFSRTVTVLQSASKTTCMGDYSIAAGALQWWQDDVASPLALGILAALTPPFAMLGWGPDELNTVTAVSLFGGAVVASDWASNLDVLSAYDVPSFARQPAAPAPASAAPPAVHTVAFLMSDGDNLQFLLDTFATGSAWWASPARGGVPMGWTQSPSLVDLAPAVASYLHRTATASDYFVAAVSGFGYNYPDEMSLAHRSALAQLSAAYMGKAGMRIVNVLGRSDAPAPAVLAPLLAAADIDAVLYYPFDDYSGLHGNVSFVGGKPVIGGRFNLWGDGSSPAGPTFCNTTQLVARLLEQVRDPASAAGYSLVPLHAWSHSVADARFVMQALQAAAPGAVDVVTPDVLVARIVANLGGSRT